MAEHELSAPARAGMDAARAFAACYVVVHHLANAQGLSHGWGMIFRFGQEAVLVFFLLSGFVVFANEKRRALAPRGYLLRRLRRIYPPLIAALTLSTILAWLEGTLAERFRWTELIGTIFSLQDVSFLKPGVIVNPYLGNEPLWSLSYEVAFYLAFPLVLRAWVLCPRLTNHLVGIVCCASYTLFATVPSHFTLVTAYFLVWWAGAMAAHAYLSGARGIRGMRSTFLWLLALCAVAATVVLIQGYRSIGYYPALPLRHFAVAAALLALLFGPLGRVLAHRLYPVTSHTTGIASISYGLYVLHYPVLVDWSVARGAWGLIVAVLVLIVLAWLVERVLPRWLPSAPRS